MLSLEAKQVTRRQLAWISKGLVLHFLSVLTAHGRYRDRSCENPS